MFDLPETVKRAREAGMALGKLDVNSRNFILSNISAFLLEREAEVIGANRKDMSLAGKDTSERGCTGRFLIDHERILSMVRTVDIIRNLEDPLGVRGGVKNADELMILRMKVPLGVVGVVYDSVPDVLAAFSALCIKTGNAVIFGGGSMTANTGRVLIDIVQEALEGQALTPYGAQILSDSSSDAVLNFIKKEGCLDAVVPAGGAELIKTVKKYASSAVIETGTGNCHVFIDESADFETAKNIVAEAKLARPWHCNAVEKIIFHKNFQVPYIAGVLDALTVGGVGVRACSRIMDIYKNCTAAKEEDWAASYKDYIIAVKLVDSVDEAIEHISKYSSGESEIIVTNNYENSVRFYNETDAAVVYVNASARFADGGVFGLGSETGISVRKTNSRGVMGLPELTCTKYVAFGKQPV